MVLPSLQPVISLSLNSSMNPFPVTSSFFSQINSIDKIREEEMKTKVPPFHYYYDQLNQELAARSSGKSIKYEEKQSFKRCGNDLRTQPTLSYAKYSTTGSALLQHNMFETDFYKKRQNSSHPNITSTHDLLSYSHAQRERLFNVATVSRENSVRLPQAQLSPLFMRREQTPCDAMSFRMENLLRSNYLDIPLKHSVAPAEGHRQKERDTFPALPESKILNPEPKLLREYSSDSGYLSDPSNYSKTSILTHDKNGRFPEIRNAYEQSRLLTYMQQEDCYNNLEQRTSTELTAKKLIETCVSSDCNDREVDITKDCSNYASDEHADAYKMMLERNSIKQRATSENPTVQCSKIDSTHTSDELKYGVEGLLGLNVVTNEHLKHVFPKEKKRAKNNNCLHLWQFLQRMLNEEENNVNRCIEWTNRDVGEFRLIKTAVIADLWGQSKNRNCMTYEKMARAMRYYYKMKILEKVKNKRLHFRFGENMLPKVLDYKSRKTNFDQTAYEDYLRQKGVTFQKFPNVDFDEIKFKLPSDTNNILRNSVICPVNKIEKNFLKLHTNYKQKKEGTYLSIQGTNLADTCGNVLLRKCNIKEDATDEHIDVENSDEETEKIYLSSGS